MNTVWIVYQHDYEDSEIRGVYGSLEKAEIVVKQVEDADKDKPALYRRHLSIQTWDVQ
jgi:hypothetical protein